MILPTQEEQAMEIRLIQARKKLFVSDDKTALEISKEICDLRARLLPLWTRQRAEASKRSKAPKALETVESYFS